MLNPFRIANAARRLRLVWRLAIAGAVIAAASTSLLAASLETAVLTEGGVSNWGTFGPAAPFYSYFNDSVPIPTIGLAAAGVAGEIKTQSAAGGVLTDQSAINATFQTNSFIGSTHVRAGFGVLSADAHGVYTGGQAAVIVDAAQGLSSFTESFTITSPSVADGTPGLVSFQFSIDGSTTSTAGTRQRQQRPSPGRLSTER